MNLTNCTNSNFSLVVASFLVFTSAAYADMRGIGVELSRSGLGETLVSVTSMVKEENQANINLRDAVTLLRNAKHLLDAIFVVMHSDDAIPIADLLPLFKAMSDNQIEIAYMQIGRCPTGMDIWNQRQAVQTGGSSNGKPSAFDIAQADAIWKELWKSAGRTIGQPKIEELSEKQIVERMAGKWTVMFGVTPDTLTLSLSTNRLVAVSGQKDGKHWMKSGEWRVVSGKLVLFLKEDSIPSFIFTT